MILAETVLFIVALIGVGSLLFLLVYFMITISDLECDYLNVHECCEKLNYWVLPKLFIQIAVNILFLFHGHFFLFMLNLPMSSWLLYEVVTVPRGNTGVYDPSEIYSQGQLRKHFNSILLHIVVYLFFFFIYLYGCILAMLKGDPNTQSDDEYITEI